MVLWFHFPLIVGKRGRPALSSPQIANAWLDLHHQLLLSKPQTSHHRLRAGTPVITAMVWAADFEIRNTAPFVKRISSILLSLKSQRHTFISGDGIVVDDKETDAPLMRLLVVMSSSQQKVFNEASVGGFSAFVDQLKRLHNCVVTTVEQQQCAREASGACTRKFIDQQLNVTKQIVSQQWKSSTTVGSHYAFLVSLDELLTTCTIRELLRAVRNQGEPHASFVRSLIVGYVEIIRSSCFSFRRPGTH